MLNGRLFYGDYLLISPFLLYLCKKDFYFYEPIKFQ